MIIFPKDFRFGVSTAAAQIETAVGHNWAGRKALDGSVFSATTGHEDQWRSDVDLIAGLAPNYRMSLLWSRLQDRPMGPFDKDAVKFYLELIEALRKKGVSILLVLHHFEEPIWFSEKGGWNNKKSVEYWLDYVRKVIDIFGEYIFWWNTFNEPNLLVSMGFISGQFPPFSKNPFKAIRALGNISKCHQEAYLLIKSKFPHSLIGLSHNSVLLEAENLLGYLPAAVTDWWYMQFIPSWYGACDYFGMSYYARIGYDPLPVTYLYHPEKFKQNNRRHDQMWEYYPEGMRLIMRRFWKRFGKPILITENGVATRDDTFRQVAIYDYLQQVSLAMEEGIPCLGYFHWTAWDNFEWNLGASYCFGLYELDRNTMRRIPRPSARYFSEIASTGQVKRPEIND